MLSRSFYRPKETIARALLSFSVRAHRCLAARRNLAIPRADSIRGVDLAL
jgi:hypothetical protein